MKILQVLSFYLPATELGGPVHSVSMLAQGLHEAGEDVEVYTTNSRGGPELPREPLGRQRVGGVPVRFFRCFGPARYYFSPAMALALIRNAGDFDIVHVHGLWTFQIVAATRACGLRSVPYVLTPRGSLDPWSLGQKGLKKKLYLRLIDRRSIVKARLIHFTAEDERRLAPEFVQQLPHGIVPNAIDLGAFLEVPERPDGDRTLHLLSMGRIHKMKGFDLLVPALAQARRRGVRVDLTIAGPDDGGYADVVRAMADDHDVRGLLEFTGNLDRSALRKQLEQADGVVMPSYRENFGMSAAEAMAAARPVIVSDQVNIASEIARAGAGIVVPLEITRLADAIESLAGDRSRRLEMGRNGRELVQREYSSDSVARRMIELYRGLISANNA